MTAPPKPTIEQQRAVLDALLLAQRTTPERRSTAGKLRTRIAAAPAPPPAVNHPAYAIEVIALVGQAAHLAQISPGWMLAGGGLAAVSTALSTHARYLHRPTTAYAAISALAAGATAGVLAEYGVLSKEGIAALGVTVTALGPVYGTLRRRHDKRLAKERLERKAELAARKRSAWEEIFDEAGAKGVHIDDINDEEWAHGERSFPVGAKSPTGYALALKLGKGAPEGKALASMTPKIEQVAARVLGLRIRNGSIRINSRGYAGEWEMIVPTKDLLCENIPFVLEDGPRSINDIIYSAMSADGIGLGVDFNVTPHGMWCGLTGTGKTTFLHTHVMETTRCEDAVTWVIAQQKPNRLFRPWMEAFLKGTPDPESPTGYVEPVIDWLATDTREACMMLLDLYKAIGIRSATAGEDDDEKWIPTKERPRIVLFIDEISDLLQDRKYRVKPWDWTGPTEEQDKKNGERTGICFSELLVKVIRLARSEGISVVFMVQRGTNDLVGDEGGTLKSQITYRVSFKQAGALEQGKTFISAANGIDVTTLGIGDIFMESGEVSAPIRGKGYRTTWDDIRAASVAHTRYAQPLDPGTADELDFYAGRWSRPGQQEYLRQIIKNPVRTIPGRAPERTGEPEADDTTRQVPDVPASVARDQIEQAAEQMALSAEELIERFPELADLDANGVADDEEAPAPTPWGARIDPTLEQFVRELLDLMSSSELLLVDWVLTREIHELALRELAGWPETESEGGKRIKAAFYQVGVTQPKRPPRKPGSRERHGQGYEARAIKAAVRRHMRSEE